MNLVAIGWTDGTGRDGTYMVRSLLESCCNHVLRSSQSPRARCALVFLFLGARKSTSNDSQTSRQNCSKATPKSMPKLLQNGSKIDPGASWRTLGAVLAASRSIGSLLERSWSALEGSWSRKNKVGIGSWPAQGHLGDRFQRSWEPNTFLK